MEQGEEEKNKVRWVNGSGHTEKQILLMSSDPRAARVSIRFKINRTKTLTNDGAACFIWTITPHSPFLLNYKTAGELALPFALKVK